MSAGGEKTDPAREPPHPWATLATRVVHETAWLRLREDRVRTHTGAELTFTFTDRTDAAFVVPLLADGSTVLLRQYRYMVDDWCWEVPAGSAKDRDPLAVARDELREEIGGEAGAWERLGSFYLSNGSGGGRATAFLARDVRLAGPEREPGELMYAVPMPFADALALARAGEISDGPSALALFLAAARIEGR